MVWLSLQDYEKGQATEAVYNCEHTAPLKPPECRHAKYLIFKFYYSPSKRLSPYGEIAYNYAEVCLDEGSVREGQLTSRLQSFTNWTARKMGTFHRNAESCSLALVDYYTGI